MRWFSFVVCSLLFVAASARAQELAPIQQTPTDGGYGQGRGTPDLGRLRMQADPYAYELQKLYRERPSMFGPITTIAVGGLTVAVPAAAMLGGWLFSGGDYLQDTTVRDFRGVIIATSVGVAVVGLGMGWMAHTIKQRAAVNRRINKVRQDRRSYFSSIGAGQPPGVLHW